MTDTGIGVRNSCANSDTRNSSSSQRNSSILGSPLFCLSFDARCHGAADGTATVNPQGGFGLYTYLWSDPLSQHTATADSLAAGT